MALRLWYVNVFVTDYARAVTFYRDTLGLALSHEDVEFGHASFDTGPTGFAVSRVDPKADDVDALVGRHTGIGFGVNDLDGEYEKLKAKGVIFTMPPTKQPWGGTLSLFKDPDGNILYLDQLRTE